MQGIYGAGYSKICFAGARWSNAKVNIMVAHFFKVGGLVIAPWANQASARFDLDVAARAPGKVFFRAAASFAEIKVDEVGVEVGVLFSLCVEFGEQRGSRFDGFGGAIYG